MPGFLNKRFDRRDEIMIDEDMFDPFDGFDVDEEEHVFGDMGLYEEELPPFVSPVEEQDQVDIGMFDGAESIDEIVISDDEKGDVDLSELVPGSDTLYKREEKKKEEKKTWERDKDHSDFMAYLKVRVTKIPKHSGQTLPGCERAKAFLRGLDGEISKAMSTDLEGLIDEVEVDEIRNSIEKMIERLDGQIGKIKGKRASVNKIKLVAEAHCKSCNSVSPMWNDTANNRLVCMSCNKDQAQSLEKTASTPIINVYISAFERAIVGIIINSKVSGGRNIEETYDKLKNKYNFAPREELAIQQLIADYGYPVFKDRGMLNEQVSPGDNNGSDWAVNYNA